jgi:hypothetical protein
MNSGGMRGLGRQAQGASCDSIEQNPLTIDQIGSLTDLVQHKSTKGNLIKPSNLNYLGSSSEAITTSNLRMYQDQKNQTRTPVGRNLSLNRSNNLIVGKLNGQDGGAGGVSVNNINVEKFKNNFGRKLQKTADYYLDENQDYDQPDGQTVSVNNSGDRGREG